MLSFEDSYSETSEMGIHMIGVRIENIGKFEIPAGVSITVSVEVENLTSNTTHGKELCCCKQISICELEGNYETVLVCYH